MPSVTQSVGVPSTMKRRSPMRVNRSGRDSVRACETAEFSRSGATTHTSPIVSSAAASTLIPSEW